MSDVADWETWRTWGHDSYNNVGGDLSQLTVENEGVDWGTISMDYQNATGKDWVTGEALSGGSTSSPAASSSSSSSSSSPATSTITGNEATHTVAGQLDSILAEDSALMKRASNMADTRTNQAGLLGSSMMQRASMSAIVDAATPIATSDAGFYNDEMINNANIASAERINAATISSNEKMNFQSLQGSLANQYMSSMTSGGMSDSFSAGEAEALTTFYNDSMSNIFTIADYSGFDFTY